MTKDKQIYKKAKKTEAQLLNQFANFFKSLIIMFMLFSSLF